MSTDYVDSQIRQKDAFASYYLEDDNSIAFDPTNYFELSGKGKVWLARQDITNSEQFTHSKSNAEEG